MAYDPDFGGFVPVKDHSPTQDREESSQERSTVYERGRDTGRSRAQSRFMRKVMWQARERAKAKEESAKYGPGEYENVTQFNRDYRQPTPEEMDRIREEALDPAKWKARMEELRRKAYGI